MMTIDQTNSTFYLDDVIALDRTVCPGAWGNFFNVGLEDARAIMEGW